MCSVKRKDRQCTLSKFLPGIVVLPTLSGWTMEKLSLGVVLIRVITSRDASELLEYFKTADYGVTSVDAQGSAGKVQVVFTIVQRREVATVVNLIKQFNPKAFYTIEEVGFVEEGIFPTRKSWLSTIFRPFRKGK